MTLKDFDFQIKKISKSKTFKKLHDDFFENQNKCTYNALKVYLRKKFDKNFHSNNTNLLPSLLFVIKGTWIFWNSSLDDTVENNFNNYMTGSIKFDNIYQYNAFFLAENYGKSKVVENNKNPNGTFNSFNYVSRKVGSTLTAGTVGKRCKGFGCPVPF